MVTVASPVVAPGDARQDADNAELDALLVVVHVVMRRREGERRARLAGHERQHPVEVHRGRSRAFRFEDDIVEVAGGGQTLQSVNLNQIRSRELGTCHFPLSKRMLLDFLAADNYHTPYAERAFTLPGKGVQTTLRQGK